MNVLILLIFFVLGLLGWVVFAHSADREENLIDYIIKYWNFKYDGAERIVFAYQLFLVYASTGLMVLAPLSLMSTSI